jgi:putative type II/III system pilus formation protein
MSAVFGRRRRLIGASAIVLALVLAATAASAENLTVSVDQAQIMKLPDKVATIVIGNPLIADASLQSGGILVVTGKSFGSTNMLALDRAGKTILDTTIQVMGPPGSELVVVYKGVDRESYSCTPECSPRIALGDNTKFFADTIGQATSRNTQAQQGK